MSRRRNVLLFLGALVVVTVVATVATQFGSDEPDGLEFVAEAQGFADQAEDSAVSDTPLADYGKDETATGGRNVALSGAIGVAVTLLIGLGVFWLARTKPGDRIERAGT